MKTILSAALAVMLALSAMNTGAQDKAADRKVELAIEQQSLADALNDWAKQTGLQLVSSSSEMMNTTLAPTIKGEYTPKGALEELLKGTSLTYEWVGERAVAIREKPLVLPAALQSSGTEHDRSSLRIAKLTDGPAQVQRFAANQPTPTGESAATRASGDTDSAVTQEVEEVVVTGTHIRGVKPTSQVITIDRTEIEAAGFTRVEDVTARLPQNFGEISYGGRLATEGGSTLSKQNEDRAASVNLRGLGAQSTLTLLDGVRQAGSIGGRVFDISMLPLSMIERVDVVTGGHAAIYGADAVAGVVNFVPRKSFSGFQMEGSYGTAEEGGERLQAGLIGGVDHGSSGFAVGYDYSQEWPFELGDVGQLTKQFSPLTGYTTTALQAQPDAHKHSAFLVGHWEINDSVNLSGNALYSDKEFELEDRFQYPDAPSESFTRSTNPSQLLSASAAADIQIPDGWLLTLNASHSETKYKQDSLAFLDLGFFSFTQDFERTDEARITSASATVNGDLFELAGAPVRTALGIERRNESYSAEQMSLGAPVPGAAADEDRTVQSVFVEFAVPLIAKGRNSNAQSLELSLAARYDDYSDFGDTTNPLVGLLWDWGNGVAVRGGFAKAFRAPALAELALSEGSLLIDAADPAAPSGVTPLLIRSGNNADLEGEKAETWNVGLDLHPAFLPGTSISISYFDVKYDDRIEVPAANFADRFSALESESLYPGLISRSPDLNSVDALIATSLTSQGFFSLSAMPFDPTSQSVADVFPNIAVFDNRTHNIAVEHANGVDLLFQHVTPVGSGQFNIGANASYIIDHDRNITTSSPALDLLNQAGKPVDFRARINLGWSNETAGVAAYVNYIDSYEDPTPEPRVKIDSWTTVDLTLHLDCERLFPSSALRGLVTTLSIFNAFDSKPPRYISSSYGALYDAANADPFGRFVSLRAVQRW
jgi:iron complex outermembrane recepter protein